MKGIIAHERAIAAVRIVLALAETASAHGYGRPTELRIGRTMISQILDIADEIKATEEADNDGS